MKRILCCLLLLAALLPGCARQPRPANTLRLAARSDLSTLDPALSYDSGSMPYVRVLYRGLIDYGVGAELVNAVARERKVSPDGKVYRFKLRTDVRFHSGRRVVAEDFRYALERVLTPATASDGFSFYQVIDGAKEFSEDKKKPKAEQRIEHVRGIRVTGDDEISLTLKQPDVTFLNYLALPFAYAVPREWVEKLEREGKTLEENPNGCGPFKFESWVRGRHLYLTKNPDYYDPTLPKCDRIELKMGGDDTLHLMRFELGDIDTQTLEDAPAPDFLRLLEDPDWNQYIQHAPMMDIRYVCLNTEMKPFNNVLVRRAMNYAIDRERIKAFVARRATVARGALPPGMPGYNPQLFQYKHDPAKAKQLLREAGYPNGFIITLWYSPDIKWYAKAAQSIQEDLKQVGVTVNLKAVTYSALKTAAGKRKNIEMSIIGWIQDFPDPANFLDVLFNGKNRTETASNNRAFYSNPKVNKLLDIAAVELNRKKRLALYQQAEKLIVDDAPWVFLLHTERYFVRQPWIKGFRLHPMWSARHEYVEVRSGD